MADSPMPMLDMLWEADDPGVVLKERFGFEDAPSAGRWVTTTVSQHWGVRVDGCERITMSSHNALAWMSTPAGRLLAKWSVAPARFPRLSRIAHLTHWLDGHGLPVSAPLPASDGRLQVESYGISISLQHVVEGDLLDVEDLAQVRAAGVTLARLHDTLAGYPSDHAVLSEEHREPLATRIANWLDTVGEHVPSPGRDALRTLVTGAPRDSLPVQLLHGDFRSSNIVCTGATVAAVLDFEEARIDCCIDELARSAVMLGTRFRDWGPVSSQVRSVFCSGYESARRLTPVEASWLDVLVLWYTLALMPPGDDPTGWGSSALSLLPGLAHRL